MQKFAQDLRYAFRQMRQSPGFTLTAVLSLALGIGATTAIFSVVEGVLLRPLPFQDPDRLVTVSSNIEGVDVPAANQSLTGPDVRAYAQNARSFSSLGGYQPSTYELSGVGEPVQVNGSRLGAGVFPTLGIAPLLGRSFTQQEDEQSQQVAVIGYPMWQTRFHGNPGVLGSKILLDRKPYVVIGVMPPQFEFPLLPGHLNNSELWVPLSLTQQELTSGAGSWNFRMIARLKPGITLVQAQADAQQVAAEIMRNYPAFMASVHIRAAIVPLKESTVADARSLVRILFLAVLVVLLITCANLAGLLLVRAIRRRREFAVRLALGAQTPALLRDALLESLVLSLSGGLLGLTLAALALKAFLKFMPETLPRIAEIGLDWQVVTFAVMLALATGALCGLAPGFAAMRTNLNDGLKEGGRTGTSGGHARLRASLVVAEIAIALVLLAASGLLLRSFEKMRAVETGIQPEHLIVANYSLPHEKYSSQNVVNQFNQELQRRLQQLPGAESAGFTSSLPMSGQNSVGTFIADGYVAPKGEGFNMAAMSTSTGDFFRAMGIKLLRGRLLNDSDRAGSALVAVVNRTLAEHCWRGQDPIGRRLRLGTAELQTPWITVVGEVADAKQNSSDVETQQQIYQPVEQLAQSLGPLSGVADINGNSGYVVLRTALPPEQLENSVRASFASLDPQLAVAQIQTMEQAVSDSEAPRRFNTSVITAFAAGAVFLAVLGIYSVVAFSVALRSQEMAIRMALGSQRTGIVRLVLASGARLATVGCLIGIPAAVAASRLLGAFLFQVSAYDPLVLTSAVATVLLLALGASALPAQRAATTDPARTLRME